MKLQEALVISAYTGVLCCPMNEYHLFVTKLLERAVFIHEFSDPRVIDQIKERVTPEFMKIVENLDYSGRYS